MLQLTKYLALPFAIFTCFPNHLFTQNNFSKLIGKWKVIPDEYILEITTDSTMKLYSHQNPVTIEFLMEFENKNWFWLKEKNANNPQKTSSKTNSGFQIIKDSKSTDLNVMHKFEIMDSRLILINKDLGEILTATNCQHTDCNEEKHYFREVYLDISLPCSTRISEKLELEKKDISIYIGQHKYQNFAHFKNKTMVSVNGQEGDQFRAYEAISKGLKNQRLVFFIDHKTQMDFISPIFKFAKSNEYEKVYLAVKKGEINSMEFNPYIIKLNLSELKNEIDSRLFKDWITE